MRILLGLSLLAVCAFLLVSLFRNYVGAPESSTVDALLSAEADFALKRLSYTETQGQQRQWTLEAVNAKYDNDSETARLEDVSLTLFRSDAQGGDLMLSSQSGQFDRSSKLVELQGDVRILQHGTGYLLQTDRLLYDAETRVVYNEQPVQFEAGKLKARGVGLRFDYIQSRLLLQDKVEAVFTVD